MRELIWMHDGLQKRNWEIASCVMALIANCHRDSKKKAFKPEQFNPTIKRDRLRDAIPVTKENAELFKSAFMKHFAKPQISRKEP